MIRMNDPGETHKGAEGEIARNSQAKGPDHDETLESRKAPKKQSRLWRIFQVKDRGVLGTSPRAVLRVGAFETQGRPRPGPEEEP